METLNKDQIINLLNHKGSADLIYYEFYSLHSELIKGMLMQTCFIEDLARTKIYSRTDWNNVIFKSDFPAYYIITKNNEYNYDQNNQLIEMNTLVFRLDSILNILNNVLKTSPKNAILTILLEWLVNSEFVRNTYYMFENEFHIEKTATELNLL